MSDFMKWALNEGQAMAVTLGYARLPEQLVPLELEQLTRMKTQRAA
jgi:hypothetical protein